METVSGDRRLLFEASPTHGAASDFGGSDSDAEESQAGVLPSLRPATGVKRPRTAGAAPASRSNSRRGAPPHKVLQQSSAQQPPECPPSSEDLSSSSLRAQPSGTRPAAEASPSSVPDAFPMQALTAPLSGTALAQIPTPRTPAAGCPAQQPAQSQHPASRQPLQPHGRHLERPHQQESMPDDARTRTPHPSSPPPAVSNPAANRSFTSNSTRPSPSPPSSRAHQPPPPARQHIEAAAASLLGISRNQLRNHRGLLTELQAFRDTPELLSSVVVVLVEQLGLAPQQLRDVVLCQPHVLRVRPQHLAERGSALAAALGLPPPPGHGEVAAVVAAAPDVLLRRGGYDGSCPALAAALALPQQVALEMLRRQPQLLRHPPGYFEGAVTRLQQRLGLAPEEAAALAAAEPLLLSVSPGVLSTNGAMLRKTFQLDTSQLAAVVRHAPELLTRPPGALRAVASRLVAVLSRSRTWREGLPRLLASSRNVAVALSLPADRYERLEYLAETGRDRFMGFKDALTLDSEEFEEVFPEYPGWRRAHGR